jgi:hypothetical protein
MTKDVKGVPSTFDVYCKAPVSIGDHCTPPDSSGVNSATWEVTEVLESKKPDEFGARPLNWDMAPAEPSYQPSLELSYAGVEGRDKPIKGKHLLTAEEHRQRRDFVKGDPKQKINHGWYWARVKVQKV